MAPILFYAGPAAALGETDAACFFGCGWAVELNGNAVAAEANSFVASTNSRVGATATAA
jgi:hypothetical protein